MELGNHANVMQIDGDAEPKSEDLDLLGLVHSKDYLSPYSRNEISTGKGMMNSLRGRSSMMHVNGGAMQGFFLGHGTSLKSSLYLRAVQELLNEFCNVGISDNFSASSSGTRTTDCGAKSESGMNQDFSSGDRLELQRRKAKLVSMLEEVDRRYKHYRNQIQAIICSFESLTTTEAATTYTALALKAMSRHFRCLRDAISNQLQITSESLGENNLLVPGTTRGETPSMERSTRQQRSVSLLRAWLFEHFLHPYPRDADKHILARQTGLTRSQVSNWFINARVRLWKPMVEEMYRQETEEEKWDSANAKEVQNADEKAESDRSNGDEKSAFKSGESNSQYTAFEDEAPAFKLQDHSRNTPISQSVHPESFASVVLHQLGHSLQRHKTDEMKIQEMPLIGESHESLSVMSFSQENCIRFDQAAPYKKIEDDEGFRSELYTTKLHQVHYDTEIPLDFSSCNISSSNSMAGYSEEQLQPRHFPNTDVSLTLDLHHKGGTSFLLGSEDKYYNSKYFSNQYSNRNNKGNGYIEQGLPCRNNVNIGILGIDCLHILLIFILLLFFMITSFLCYY